MSWLLIGWFVAVSHWLGCSPAGGNLPSSPWGSNLENLTFGEAAVSSRWGNWQRVVGLENPHRPS